MICFPNAKVNLGLFVTEKRNDGFHNIESIFFPVDLKDALEATPADHNTCHIHFSGKEIAGNPESNLIFRAWKILDEEHSIGGVDMALLKNIPMGAGMGGGSADGAFTLTLLNNLFELNLTADTLKSYAAHLGSDCPFFIDNKAAYVSGRGEMIEPIDLDLSSYEFRFEHPAVHVSTPEAYRMISPSPSEINLRQAIQRPIQEWASFLRNDFEAPMLNTYPAIREAKEKLYQDGAIYASMSGSGSSVFGLFEKK